MAGEDGGTPSVEAEGEVDVGASTEGAGDAEPGSLPRARRGPQQPILETSYLTALSVGHYRPLMRFFFEAHQAQRFFLGVDEAWRHIRQAYDAAYTVELCQQELQQLVAWGNLTRHFERSRVRTIEEFLRRQAVYQITPEGVAVERFVEALQSAGRRAGSLDKTVLDALLARMRELDALLADPRTLELLAPQDAPGAAADRPPPGEGPPPRERICSLWAEVRHHFERVANDGVGYLGQLRGVQAQQILEHSAFQAYKDVLVRYLSTYALALAAAGPLIADLAQGWADGARGRLIALCAGSVAARQPLPDGRYPDLAEEIERVRGGVLALARWFHPVQGDITRLKRSTNDAIELVTRQAARLAELHWGTRSRRRDLEELAILFGHCAELSQAERVAGVAFAAAFPRQWQGEGIPEEAGRASPWQEPAVEVALVPVRRGARIAVADQPAPERHAERASLLRAGLRGRREAARRMEALFPQGWLDLAQVTLARAEQRDLLLDLLGRCLASPDGVADAPDGGRVSVTARDPGLGQLVAPDGVCHVPCLVLVWEPGRQREAAAAAEGGAQGA